MSEDKEETIYCITQGCDFEASEERESPVSGDTINLCYTCSQAYDMGVEHGLVSAES